MAVISEPMPIIVPMYLLGACSVMMLNMSGRAMPVPMPSVMRPASSIGNDCAVMPSTMPVM